MNALLAAWATVGLTPVSVAGLIFAALTAGFFDAIAGGGGLITVPALLATKLPIHMAFGTNKGQAVWGSGAATWSFWRAGLVERDRAIPSFIAGFVGSLLGAVLLLSVSPAVLRPVVMVLLVIVAVFMTFRPPLDPKPKNLSPNTALAIAVGLAVVIGCYDGFFGPGTGTFLIIGQVLLLGTSMKSGSANAKVVNFASNLAAFGLLAWQGQVAWAVALPMALAQFIGATLGVRAAIRGGDKLIRWVVLAVCLGLCAKLAFDAWGDLIRAEFGLLLAWLAPGR